MAIAPKTKKVDEKYKNRIYPIIDVGIAQNLILQNNRLEKSIRILAQDAILNDMSFISQTESDEELIHDFWKNDINEKYYSYGFGASEIIFDEKTGKPKELYQIPTETLSIKQETNSDGTFSYYAIEEIVEKPIVKIKLSKMYYIPSI